jgi:FMN-dependent NADH-azoreductase
MPNLLDVHALPRGATSRTRRLRDAFVRGYVSRHPKANVMELDLAKGHELLPVIDEWDIAAKFEMAYGEGKLGPQAAKRWEALSRLTDPLFLADTIVLSTPMWNFSIPWMVKRWIDSVVQARLTFEYRNGKFEGLLGGRTVVLLTSRDGAYGPGSEAASLDFQLPYLRQIFRFVGITTIHEVVAEPMALQGPQAGAAALERAVIEADALGRRL